MAADPDVDAAVVARHVAGAVLGWFRGSGVCQKKHPPTEWTVLAGIVVRQRRADGEGDDVYRVLAIGTGTKCLGRRDLNPHGLVVNDCHAEIVARRALLCYLYQEAREWQRRGMTPHPSPSSSIFAVNSATGRLGLAPGHELHLYISEAPCGDAAIYALREDVVDGLVRQRLARESRADAAVDAQDDVAVVNGDDEGGDRSDVRLTGAKRRRASESSTGAPGDKRFEQIVGVARVKSGRSDLPVDKQTLSMSCSDKLAKWMALGIQGTLLLRWFDPLFLTSVVVSADPAVVSSAAQQQAMTRALWARIQLNDDGAGNGEKRQLTTFHVLEDAPFDRAKAIGKSASPLSLNWTTQEPHWEQDERELKALGGHNKVEIVVGATGFKQGAKKASKMDRTAMTKVASRLCKWNLFCTFAAISDLPPDNRQSYLEHKERVLEDVPAALGAPARALFFGAIDSWVGVPREFKSFAL